MHGAVRTAANLLIDHELIYSQLGPVRVIVRVFRPRVECFLWSCLSRCLDSHTPTYQTNLHFAVLRWRSLVLSHWALELLHGWRRSVRLVSCPLTTSCRDARGDRACDNAHTRCPNVGLSDLVASSTMAIRGEGTHCVLAGLSASRSILSTSSFMPPRSKALSPSGVGGMVLILGLPAIAASRAQLVSRPGYQYRNFVHKLPCSKRKSCFR
jgi:hypothetical protein